MYKYVFCCYIESDFGGEPYITYVPMETKELGEELYTSIGRFYNDVGSYIPTRIEHSLHRLKRTSLNEETKWVMVKSGKYAGLLGLIEDIGKKGVAVLDLEVGITYLMPKEDVVAIPIWDFRTEKWTLDI